MAHIIFKIPFLEREEHVTTSNNSTLQRVLSERPASAKRSKKDSPKGRDVSQLGTKIEIIHAPTVCRSLFKASPSLQDLEKAQLELENQLGNERRESIRPKSANIPNPTQIEPKKPERNNAIRKAKSTNDTGTQDLIQKILK